MLSPRHAHGFANNIDLINYERGSNQMNYTQKIPGSSQGNRGSSMNVNNTKGLVINPQNIQFARAT